MPAFNCTDWSAERAFNQLRGGATVRHKWAGGKKCFFSNIPRSVRTWGRPPCWATRRPAGVKPGAAVRRRCASLSVFKGASHVDKLWKNIQHLLTVPAPHLCVRCKPESLKWRHVRWVSVMKKMPHLNISAAGYLFCQKMYISPNCTCSATRIPRGVPLSC